MDTHQWTAVIGTGRLVSVQAPDEDAAREELNRQLSKNPQRREILAQWQGAGSRIEEQPQSPALTTTTAAAELDQAAGEAGRILEAMRHPGSPEGPDTDELVSMVQNAQQQIAEATETLRQVCDLTNDLQRGAVMVAHLEALVGSGGWCSLERETLDGWIKELETGEEV